MKKLIYRIVKEEDGKYSIKVLFFKNLKVRDTHIGYGGTIIEELRFLIIKDAKRVIELLPTLTFTVHWTFFHRNGIRYFYKSK